MDQLKRDIATLCGMIDTGSEANGFEETMQLIRGAICAYEAHATRDMRDLKIKYAELKDDFDDQAKEIAELDAQAIGRAKRLREVMEERDQIKLVLEDQAGRLAMLEARKTFFELQGEVHALAREKGWWDGVGELGIDGILARIALVHAELSEAVETVRDGGDHLGGNIDGGGKPEGLAIELADAVIRIMDLCGGLGLDLAKAIKIKHEFNKTRPFRHGGKLA